MGGTTKKEKDRARKGSISGVTGLVSERTETIRRDWRGWRYRGGFYGKGLQEAQPSVRGNKRGQKRKERTRAGGVSPLAQN